MPSELVREQMQNISCKVKDKAPKLQTPKLYLVPDTVRG